MSQSRDEAFLPQPDGTWPSSAEMTWIDQRVASQIDPVKQAVNQLARTDHESRAVLDDILDRLDDLRAPVARSKRPWGCMFAAGAVVVLLVTIVFLGWRLYQNWPPWNQGDGPDQRQVEPADEVIAAARSCKAIEAAGRSQLYIATGKRALDGEFESLAQVRDYLKSQKAEYESRAFAEISHYLDEYNGENYSPQIGNVLINLGEGFK